MTGEGLRDGPVVFRVDPPVDSKDLNQLFDTTVDPKLRQRGIGRGLVTRAAAEARDRNVEWLHVDFEPQLRPFYDACGFKPTDAGLLYLGTR